MGKAHSVAELVQQVLEQRYVPQSVSQKPSAMNVSTPSRALTREFPGSDVRTGRR